MTDTSKALEALSRIFDYCEEIDNNIPEEERTGYNMLDDIDIIRRTLKELENQKIGHWIENAPEWQNIDPPYICSECGNFHLRKTNYCDQCGAKMIEPQKSKKIDCKTTKCENCINHNYCDFESQESRNKE